jgi:hypothetical protein
MDRDTVCYYLCILTQAHLGLNQTGEANKALIKAAETAPQNPMPRKILGDIYAANNRIADAFKAYRKAVELDPDYQPAKEKLGELIAIHGDQVPAKKPKDREAISHKAEKLPPAAGNQPTVIATTAIPLPATVAPANKQPAKTAELPKIAPAPALASTSDELPTVATTAAITQKSLPESSTKPPQAKNNTVDERPRPVPGISTADTASRPVPESATATPASGSNAVVSDAPAADAAQLEEKIDKLLAGSVEEKKEAAAFFIKLEEKGLNEIEELIYDSDPEVRIIAVRILPEFKAFLPRVKTILNDAAEDPDPAVAEEINKALQSL